MMTDLHWNMPMLTGRLVLYLKFSSDSLMTCNNNFLGQDSDPLILDTSNPAFPIFYPIGLHQWIPFR